MRWCRSSGSTDQAASHGARVARVPARSSPAPRQHSSATRAAAGDRNGAQIAPLARRSRLSPLEPVGGEQHRGALGTAGDHDRHPLGGCLQLRQHAERQVARAERHQHHAVGAARRVPEHRTVVAQSGGHDRDPVAPSRRRPAAPAGSGSRAPRPAARPSDPSGPAVGDPNALGPVLSTLRTVIARVDLAAEHDHRSQAGGLREARDRHRVEEVRWAVGAGLAAGAVGAGEHDRRLAVVHERAQHRELLHRVGPGRDHHALAAGGRLPRSLGRASSASTGSAARPAAPAPSRPPAAAPRRAGGARSTSCAASSAGTACSPRIAIVPPAASSRTGRWEPPAKARWPSIRCMPV